MCVIGAPEGTVPIQPQCGVRYDNLLGLLFFAPTLQTVLEHTEAYAGAAAAPHLAQFDDVCIAGWGGHDQVAA